MQYKPSNINAYKTTEVRTSNRLDLLVMLFDGAIRFMNQAKERMVAKDIPAKGMYISKALAIIAEFKNTLSYDFDPQLAQNLESLYNFIQDRLIKSNISNDPKGIEEALKITFTLREGWKQLQADMQNGEVDKDVVDSEKKAINSDNYFRISV